MDQQQPQQSVELPEYRSHKVVRAAKITELRENGIPGSPDLVLGEIGGIVAMPIDWFNRHTPQVGGYYVLYADGYTSYSPAKAFEEGYKREDGSARVVDHLIEAKITGTRPLSESEAALINRTKSLAEQCGKLIDDLRKYVPPGDEPLDHKPGDELDQRWISIGATDLQRGFMAITRGIAQPTTF